MGNCIFTRTGMSKPYLSRWQELKLYETILTCWTKVLWALQVSMLSKQKWSPCHTPSPPFHFSSAACFPRSFAGKVGVWPTTCFRELLCSCWSSAFLQWKSHSSVRQREKFKFRKAKTLHYCILFKVFTWREKLSLAPYSQAPFVIDPVSDLN